MTEALEQRIEILKGQLETVALIVSDTRREAYRANETLEQALALYARVESRLSQLLAESSGAAGVSPALRGQWTKITGGSLYVGRKGVIVEAGADAVDIKICRGIFAGDAYATVSTGDFEIIPAPGDAADVEASEAQLRPFYDRVEAIGRLGVRAPLVAALDEAHQAALSYQEARSFLAGLKGHAVAQRDRA